jgi:cell division septation protein DedD
MKKNKKVSLPKKPLLELSRRAITGWVCFIFFVCDWMFFVGVLVGRGTAPVKFDIAGLQKKLEASREDLKNKEQLRTQGKSGIVKDKTKLDFYEALRDNREDTQIGKKKPSALIGKKIESVPEKEPPVKKNGETETGVTKKAETPETGSAKTSQTPPIASQSNTRPSVKTYTIQIASVKDAKDADRLVAKLKKKGFYAYRAIGKVPGKGIWYRVRVGEYKSRTAARHTLNKLGKTGLKPIVVEK